MLYFRNLEISLNRNHKTKAIMFLMFAAVIMIILSACGNNSLSIEENDDSQLPEPCNGTDNFHMPMERDKVTETAPRTGCFAPEFTLKDLQGKNWSLEEESCGQALIVIFWKSDCSHCIENLRLLQELHTSEERIEVVAVNVQEEFEAVYSFAREKGYTFQILLDSEGEVYEEYLLDRVPVTFAINARREITFIQRGPMGEENLEMLRRSALEMMELYPIIK